MRVMGIDFGEARIGVALSDPTGLIATPKLVLAEKDKGRQISRVVELIAEYEVAKVVVGIPFHMDGTPGKMAVMAEKYAAKLEAVSGVEVIRLDERLSSVEAEAIMKANRRKGRGKPLKESIDMVAAAVILQSYLDGETFSAF
jgi:putative Holliday junction resolvase